MLRRQRIVMSRHRFYAPRFSVRYGGEYSLMTVIKFTLFWGLSPSLPLVRHFLYSYLPLTRQNVSYAQNYRRLIANNGKQFTIVFTYRYSRFCVSALRKQDVKIEISLSLASCLWSSVISWGETQKFFPFTQLFAIITSPGRPLRLLATELHPYGN